MSLATLDREDLVMYINLQKYPHMTPIGAENTNSRQIADELAVDTTDEEKKVA